MCASKRATGMDRERERKDPPPNVASGSRARHPGNREGEEEKGSSRTISKKSSASLSPCVSHLA